MAIIGQFQYDVDRFSQGMFPVSPVKAYSLICTQANLKIIFVGLGDNAFLSPLYEEIPVLHR